MDTGERKTRMLTSLSINVRRDIVVLPTPTLVLVLIPVKLAEKEFYVDAANLASFKVLLQTVASQRVSTSVII